MLCRAIFKICKSDWYSTFVFVVLYKAYRHIISLYTESLIANIFKDYFHRHIYLTQFYEIIKFTQGCSIYSDINKHVQTSDQTRGTSANEMMDLKRNATCCPVARSASVIHKNIRRGRSRWRQMWPTWTMYLRLVCALYHILSGF